MRRFPGLLVLVLLCAASGDALAAGRIAMQSVGEDGPGGRRTCTPGGFLAAGDTFDLRVDGRRSTAGSVTSGWMRVVGETSAFEVVTGTPLRFRADRAPEPDRVTVRVKPGTPDGDVTLTMHAVDVNTVASNDVSCTVRITRRRFSVLGMMVVETADNGWELRAALKNESKAVLRNVPWRVRVLKRTRGLAAARPQWMTIKSGVVEMPAEGVVNVAASIALRGAAENAEIDVTMDAANSLNEPEQLRGDNRRTTRKTIPTSVRLLDPAKAAAAGATFPVNQLDATGCRQLGVGDWADPGWDNWLETPRSTGVLFIADCTIAPGTVIPTGTRADPDAYLGFTLRNGWTVHSVDELEAYVDPANPSARSTGTFEWQIKPTPGSTTPRLKAHLVAGPGQVVKRGVRVYITGLANTDPYR